MKIDVYKLNNGTYIAVPRGQQPPTVGGTQPPVLVKHMTIAAGDKRVALDANLALADIAAKGWHAWKVQMDFDCR